MQAVIIHCIMQAVIHCKLHYNAGSNNSLYNAGSNSFKLHYNAGKLHYNAGSNNSLYNAGSNSFKLHYNAGSNSL